MPEKSEIVDLLDNIASIMEFKGENPFKVSAFRNAGNSIRKFEGDIEEMAGANRLGEIKGVGKETAKVVSEFMLTGNSIFYQELISDIPSGVLDMFEIRGIGPKKINVIYKELNIISIPGLAAACRRGEIAKVKGFGEKTQAKILEEIEKLERNRKFILMDRANKLSAKSLATLSSVKAIEKIEVSGEVRRNMEVVQEIIFVALCPKKNAAIKSTAELFTSAAIDDDELIISDFPVPVKVFFTQDTSEYYNLLFSTTATAEVLSAVKYTGSIAGVKSEEDIFKKLKMSYIPPEMREPQYFTIKDAAHKKPPSLSFGDFNGLLHFHTNASDGNNTLEEMINAGSKLGFKFFAVCDHSKNAAYANGLTEERILAQRELTKALSKKLNVRVYQGIESDILTDGRLDYSPDFLSNFDFIVASVHSQFNLSETDMTARIIKAVENPNTDALGHPTGRLLLARDGYQLNIKKVIDACAANSVAIEINANPHRLDLDWRNIFYAREKGALFTINPDAHSTQDIELTNYGVLIARKGGIQKEEVINCFSIQEFDKFLSRKIKRNF